MEKWTLTFELDKNIQFPDGKEWPMVVRIRKLLKTALRAYGLRCIKHVSEDDFGHLVPVDHEFDCTKKEPPFA
jgi:hypothetical protein